jgi:hypothetical protein
MLHIHCVDYLIALIIGNVAYTPRWLSYCVDNRKCCIYTALIIYCVDCITHVNQNKAKQWQKLRNTFPILISSLYGTFSNIVNFNVLKLQKYYVKKSKWNSSHLLRIQCKCLLRNMEGPRIGTVYCSWPSIVHYITCLPASYYPKSGRYGYGSCYSGSSDVNMSSFLHYQNMMC